MAIDPFANCSNIPSYECTLETCCLAHQSPFNYIPSFGGNLFYAIFFGVCIISQLGFGIKYKTWGFAVGMIIGLVLEVLGYASRLILHHNPFDSNGFLIYLIALTIAPVFISAAIYLCITRIITLYGAHNSRFAPRTVAIVFMTSDFLSLLLQAIGGAIADTAKDNQASLKRTGVDIMIAGLFLQAVSLTVFILVFVDFSWRCHKGVLDMNPAKLRTRQSLVFKLFRASLLLATLAILIRSIFRVIELWEGFSGSLWNNETDFLVLDGAMMAIAVLCLTASHPGVCFGGQWQAADWNFRGKKNGGAKEIPLDSQFGSRRSS